MKKYKLAKDYLRHNGFIIPKGTVFQQIIKAGCYETCEVFAGDKFIFFIKAVEENPEWFEEVKEPLEFEYQIKSVIQFIINRNHLLKLSIDEIYQKWYKNQKDDYII